MRPYDQLPFQFSVHSQKGPGAELAHYEFLATDSTDPRREFITSLCSALGKSGSIVVYSAFESQRLSELAAWLPEFADQITNIQARLWDLLPVVRNHVYHPRFAGSYSIKNALPALVPEMSYVWRNVCQPTPTRPTFHPPVAGNLSESRRRALAASCRHSRTASPLASVHISSANPPERKLAWNPEPLRLPRPRAAVRLLTSRS